MFTSRTQSFSTDPNHPRYVPEFPIRFQQIALPALYMVASGFPDSLLEQRAMMHDCDRELYSDHGVLLPNRTAESSEHVPLSLGSFPQWMKIQVRTCHDIRTPVEDLTHAALQVSLIITFSTAINSFEPLSADERFMNGKKLERFLYETALAAGLREGEPNIVYPGQFLASYGEIYGDSAYSQRLTIHSNDFPAYRRSLVGLCSRIQQEIDTELEDLFFTSPPET